MNLWQRISQGDSINLKDLGESPALKQLESTPQTKKYHAEGNVAIHTLMVYEKANALIEEHRLSDQEAKILRLAAIMHDTGKPKHTTKLDNATYSAAMHEYESARIVANLSFADAWWINQPLELRWAVHTMVRNHMWIYAAKHNRLSQGAAIRSSWLVDPKLLMLLWEADVTGRICDDADKLKFELEYAKALLESYGADQPEAFPHTRWVNLQETAPRIKQQLLYRIALGKITNGGEAHAFVEDKARADEGPTLTYTIGLPASGKSTWALQQEDCVILSADGHKGKERKRAYAQMRRQVPELLAEGTDVLIDGTNLYRDTRHRWVDIAARHNAHVKAVWFDVGLEECLTRQITRNYKEYVPEAVVQKMSRDIRFPTPDEYSELLIIEE